MMNQKSRLIQVLILIALVALSSNALAWKRHHNNNNNWGDNYENRRDARRAGAIAGAITYNVVRSNQNQRTYENREDCLQYTNDYDYCTHQSYQDERENRRDARRTAVLVGATTRAIVRDH
jgi:hypothetical protein